MLATGCTVRENRPALPASDWSIVRIYLRFVRPIGCGSDGSKCVECPVQAATVGDDGLLVVYDLHKWQPSLTVSPHAVRVGCTTTRCAMKAGGAPSYRSAVHK
eukprot:6188993-Pyramimonas_sp.AAC.1